jgi:hypothetical protein
LTKTGEYGFVSAKSDTGFLAYERIVSFGADHKRPPIPQLKEGEII